MKLQKECKHRHKKSRSQAAILVRLQNQSA